MAYTYNDLINLGPTWYHLSNKDLFEAGAALKKEVSRRLKQGRRDKRLQKTRAYNHLTDFGKRSGELIIMRAPDYEELKRRYGVEEAANRMKKYRGELLKEVKRGLDFVKAQSSSLEGLRAWRAHVIDAIAESANISTSEANKIFAFGRFNEFFELFDEIRKANTFFYLIDSDQFIEMAFRAYTDNATQNMTTQERVEWATNKIKSAIKRMADPTADVNDDRQDGQYITDMVNSASI